jgi:hypothetical protein
MLLSLLGLSDDSTGTSDVVFVAIDFENAESIRKKTSSEEGWEIGIAVLDTGQLDDMISAVSSMYYCPGNIEDFIAQPTTLLQALLNISREKVGVSFSVRRCVSIQRICRRKSSLAYHKIARSF